jgi:hypothetical protein
MKCNSHAAREPVEFNIILSAGEDEKKMGIMDVLSRIDETLAQYNIDSSSCMQRVVCSYIKLTSEKVTDGSANSLDELVDSAAG